MKNFYLVALIVFGFFLMPNAAFACGNSSKKSCCKTEMNSGNCKMKCCNKKQKDKSDTGCDGKCGKNTCQIQTVSFGAILQPFIEIKSKFFLVSNSKQAFYSKETYLSSGFYFIWSPPNIG